VDERLWRGAYEQGWRVYIKGKRNDGHYWYVTPKGRRLGSKTEALSLGVQRKQPTSRPASVLKWPLLSAAARPPGLLGRIHRVLRCSHVLHEERPLISPCPCGGLWRHRPADPRWSVGTLNTQAADGYHSGLGQDERGRRLRPKLD
jgi:hypothetical protein